jgi:hypothetical protein
MEAPEMAIPALVLLLISLASVAGIFLRVADSLAGRRTPRRGRARGALIR